MTHANDTLTNAAYGTVVQVTWAPADGPSFASVLETNPRPRTRSVVLEFAGGDQAEFEFANGRWWDVDDSQAPVTLELVPR